MAGAGALVALVVAYRRQKVAEADSVHDQARVLNERFTAIAAQLGDAQPAVRLAGVHAMAGLADDWQANRQTCIHVLCAYLRMPYEPDPDEGHRRRSGWPSAPAARCATPSSGSSPPTSNATQPYPGKAGMTRFIRPRGGPV